MYEFLKVRYIDNKMSKSLVKRFAVKFLSTEECSKLYAELGI